MSLATIYIRGHTLKFLSCELWWC